MQKEQVYHDCCKWLVNNLLRANGEKDSKYSLVELGGPKHYRQDGKTLATMARTRLENTRNRTAMHDLDLLWKIQSGLFTDTADSAEKTADLSNGIRVLPAVPIHADGDKTSGQTPIWSTGVTVSG